MEITTREVARENYKLRYFTGKPCKYGHVAERYVISGGCVKCLREYSDRYRGYSDAPVKVKYITLPYRTEADLDTLQQIADMLLEQSKPAPVDIHAERARVRQLVG